MGFTVDTYSFAPDDGSTGDAQHLDGDSATSFELGFGPRLLITIAEGEQARLYTGVGVALLIGLLNSSAAGDNGNCVPVPGASGACGGWDSYGFAMVAPMGVEYRLRSVPNLAISAEINFHFVFQSVGRRFRDAGSGDGPHEITSEAQYNHVSVGLGNARQSGPNILDFLSFLTFGVHWLI